MRICFCFFFFSPGKCKNVKFVVVPNLNHQKKEGTGTSKEEVKWVAEKEYLFL